MGRGMVSNNEFKLDVIGIDNSAHARYIVAVNAYLFRGINMSINKDDFLKFDDNSQSNSIMTCSSPRRPLFLHAFSFECTSNLCINFLNQF